MDSDNESYHSESEFYAYARFELNFFNNKFNTKVAFKAVPKKKLNTLFAVLGRSVLGKTVPLVLSTALGLLKTKGTVFPKTRSRTDQGRQIAYISSGIFWKFPRY